MSSSSSFDIFGAAGEEIPGTASGRSFEDDGFLGYESGIPSQRFDPSYAFDEVEESKAAADGDAISVDGSFPPSPNGFGYRPPEPQHVDFSAPLPESNGKAYDDEIFGGSSEGPILPAPAEMDAEAGFILREWRRQNAILLEEKEMKEKELRHQIIIEADEYKNAFYEKLKVTCERNKSENRETEKRFLAKEEAFHANADKQYWKAIAELIPNEVPNIEKKRGKKDQEKKPSIVVIQGPKPGKPTDISRMRQILVKLKHTPPPHMKPPQPAPVTPAKDGASGSGKQNVPSKEIKINGTPATAEATGTMVPEVVSTA